MATGVVSAVIVDAVRLVVYGTAMLAGQFNQVQVVAMPVAVGTVCAFIGSLIGKRLLQKVTLRTVQLTVAIAMLGIGAGLAFGFL